MSTTRETLWIPTMVAHAGFDDHSFRGHRLFADLLGKTPTSAMIVLAITGRVLNAEECGLIDDLVVVNGLADPRIWPLKITRLVGSYGRFVPAFAASYLSLDGAGFGPAPCESFARQLRDILARVEGREDDHAVVRSVLKATLADGERLAGFGVPLRSPDERVVALTAVLEARGRTKGRYWRLLSSLAAVMREAHTTEPNTVAALTVVLLDLGFEPAQIGPLTMAIFSVSLFANAAEGALEPAASLRHLPRDRVNYVGHPPRESPRSMGVPSR